MKTNRSETRRGFLKKAMIAGAAATHISPGIWTGTGTITVADPGTNDNPNNSNKANGCTVLFQGDSITDGNRTRNLDWNHVLGHGYAYLISSRLWYTHTDKGLHFFNRGISGNKVTDLAARWQQDTLDIKPDVLSILVGVNDVDSMFIKDNPAAVPADRFEKEYHALLQQTKERLPDTMLVIMEPFILPVGKVRDNWEAWSAEMKTRQQITRRLAMAFGAVFIDLQDAFNKACQRAPADYWIWDGIHPMPAGHELMAREWIGKAGKKLPLIR